MKTPRPWLVVLSVVVAAQLAIPATMVRQREATLRHGRAYKFRTRPVDPIDAFRGRYIQLWFEQDHAPWSGGEIGRGATGYARVEENADGFAVVRAVSAERPKQGDFFKVQASYAGWEINASTVYFQMPFDRFYLEETKAPTAERVYWENNRRGQSNSNTYAVVRIHNGDAALAELYVGGKPIAEFVKTH
jgi:hypothetical protein